MEGGKASGQTKIVAAKKQVIRMPMFRIMMRLINKWILFSQRLCLRKLDVTLSSPNFPPPGPESVTVS